jgi:hypothetical protein
MEKDKTRVLVSVFADKAQAECAVDALREAGLSDDEFGIAMRQPTDSGDPAMTTTDKLKHAGKATAGGAVAGGVIGSLVGAAGALLIPGIGPVLAGGMLASVLGGAAFGMAAGGLAGALDGLSIPEDEARFVDEEFQAGRIIMTVQPGVRPEELVQLLRNCGGYDIHTRPKPADKSAAEAARSA